MPFVSGLSIILEALQNSKIFYIVTFRNIFHLVSGFSLLILLSLNSFLPSFFPFFLPSFPFFLIYCGIFRSFGTYFDVKCDVGTWFEFFPMGLDLNFFQMVIKLSQLLLELGTCSSLIFEIPHLP